MNVSLSILSVSILLSCVSAFSAPVDLKSAKKSYRMHETDLQQFSRRASKDTNVVAELDAAKRANRTNDTTLSGELTSFRLTADDEAAIAALLGEIPGIEPQISMLTIGVQEHAVLVMAPAYLHRNRDLRDSRQRPQMAYSWQVTVLALTESTSPRVR